MDDWLADVSAVGNRHGANLVVAGEPEPRQPGRLDKGLRRLFTSQQPVTSPNREVEACPLGVPLGIEGLAALDLDPRRRDVLQRDAVRGALPPVSEEVVAEAPDLRVAEHDVARVVGWAV